MTTAWSRDTQLHLGGSEISHTNVLGVSVKALDELHVIQSAILVGVSTLHQVGNLLPEHTTD